MSHFHELAHVERASVERAVDKRKAEFADGRWCARQALAQLGAPQDLPIPVGEKRMPIWPTGYVGSITHTQGLRAAVAAPDSIVRGIGIDAEPADELPPGVVETIAEAAERTTVKRWEDRGASWAGTLLFSAKEATYKCWFPLTHRWLGFDDATVELREDGTFSSRILSRPTPIPVIEGRWLIYDGYVVTAAFLATV